MITYFSKQGLERLDRQISEQAQLVLDAGQQVGEEAGISCDWHDNFGFEEARRRLDMESGRLRELKATRESAQIAPPTTDDGKVSIGSQVTFFLGEDERQMVIGGSGETDTKIGIVAYDSPIAKALLGMSVGDIRDVTIQGNNAEIEIISLNNDGIAYSSKLAMMYDTTRKT